MNITASLKRFILFIVMMICTSVSYSAQFEGTGKVAFIRSFDSATGADWDWIGVEGFTSAGACLTLLGYVILMMRSDSQGDRMMSMALTARVSGKTVRVTVNESLTVNGGYCLIKYIDILGDS